jgi:hypothetical protein
MKTTIEIPDELLIAAKKRAAELRVPLRQLVAEGLQTRLDQNYQPRRQRPRIHWVVVDGGLPPGLDPADRETIYQHLDGDSGDRG